LFRANATAGDCKDKKRERNQLFDLQKNPKVDGGKKSLEKKLKGRVEERFDFFSC
jgi:hypothetical protein